MLCPLTLYQSELGDSAPHADRVNAFLKQKQFLGGPVSRVLTKYGLGKIAKDEVVIVAVLSMHVFHVTSEIKKAKAQKFAGPDSK